MTVLGSMSELRSTGHNWVPLLATRCLYQGECLTKGQPDPKAENMSNWPDIVLLLATRCLYWGINVSSDQLNQALYHSWPLDASTGGSIWPKVSLTQRLTNVKLTWCGTTFGHQMLLPGVWAQVNQTHLSTTLGHEMSLPRGTSELRSTWPNLVP